ncbi:hypothetical protein PMAYCL1PPCAC_15825, partial [Pristionchus mayeri]
TLFPLSLFALARERNCAGKKERKPCVRDVCREIGNCPRANTQQLRLFAADQDRMLYCGAEKMEIIASAEPSTSSDKKSSSNRVYRCIKTLGCPCSVCGHPATGIHYLAISCNGCRSFFRRTVALRKTYACKRADPDKLECFKEFGCKSCRFALCEGAGMNAEAVKTEEGEECERENNDLPTDIQVPIVPQLSPIELKMDKKMLDLLIVEEAHHRLRISNYLPRHEPGLLIDQFLIGPSKLGMGYAPMQDRPYEPYALETVPAEVIIKKRYNIDFRNFDYSTKKLWTFQDPIYSIEFMKALPIYHELDECSKRVLIASALACTNMTAAYFSYANHSDRTCYPDGGIKTWDRELEEQSPGTVRFNTGLISAIREAKLDQREYVLLKMIIVCNPLLEGLSSHGSNLLRNERERCAKILFSYVLARRGMKEGPAAFAKILSIIEVVVQLTTWMKNQCILMHALGLRKYRVPFLETLYYAP